MEGKHEFDFFFTHHSLPYKVNERYPPDYTKKICQDMARQTEKILRQSILESKGKMYKMVGKELPD